MGAETCPCGCWKGLFTGGLHIDPSQSSHFTQNKTHILIHLPQRPATLPFSSSTCQAWSQLKTFHWLFPLPVILSPFSFKTWSTSSPHHSILFPSLPVTGSIPLPGLWYMPFFCSSMMNLYEQWAKVFFHPIAIRASLVSKGQISGNQDRCTIC